MKKLACFSFLFVLAHGAAFAQKYEVSVFGMYPRFGRPLLGSLSATPNDKDTWLTGQYGFGARITANTKGYYGHELGYMMQRVNFHTDYTTTVNDASVTTRLEDRVKVQQAFYNFLVYFMPRDERWRPFITGGFQVAQYGAPRIAIWPGGGSRNFGGNFGGGIKLKLFPHAQARLDIRDYLGGKPYGQLNFSDVQKAGGLMRILEGSVGLGITF